MDKYSYSQISIFFLSKNELVNKDFVYFQK